MFPKQGDTVKIKLKEEYPRIGIVKYFFSEFIVIDFGHCLRYIDKLSTIYVKIKHTDNDK